MKKHYLRFIRNGAVVICAYICALSTIESRAIAENSERNTAGALLNSVTKPFGEPGSLNSQSPEVKAAVLKAWTSYCEALGTPHRWPGADLPWAQALQACHLQEEAAPALEKALANEKLTKTYGFYTLAVEVLGSSKPARAIELLRQAWLLIPKDKDGKENPTEVVRYCDKMVELLLVVEGNKEPKRDAVPDFSGLKEAIKYQKVRVNLTGQGWAELIRLQSQVNDKDGVKTTLKLMSAPQIAGAEINETAETLLELWDVMEKVPASDEEEPDEEADSAPLKKKRPVLRNRRPKYPYAGWQAAVLLSNYLNYLHNLSYLDKSASRDVEQELRTRWRLSQLYLDTDKLDEARNVLDLTTLQFDIQKLNPQARFYYTEINKLKNNWQKLLVADRSPG